jgi:DNA primase
VDREKGLYHCFGCGAGGDVVHFVRQMDRLDFRRRSKRLASRFGVTVPRRASRGPRDDRREKPSKRSEPPTALPGATGEAGNKAAAYLQGRDVSEDLVKRLGLGYAPDSWDALSRRSFRFSESLLIEAGLLQPRQEGKSGPTTASATDSSSCSETSGAARSVSAGARSRRTPSRTT